MRARALLGLPRLAIVPIWLTATTWATSCALPQGSEAYRAPRGKAEYPAEADANLQTLSGWEALEPLAWHGWQAVCDEDPESCGVDVESMLQQPQAIAGWAGVGLTLHAAEADMLQFSEEQIALRSPEENAWGVAGQLEGLDFLDSAPGADTSVFGTDLESLHAALEDGTYLLIGLPPEALPLASPEANAGRSLLVPIDYQAGEESSAAVTAEQLEFDFDYGDYQVRVVAGVWRIVADDATLTLAAPDDVVLQLAGFRLPNPREFLEKVFRSNGGNARRSRYEFLKTGRHLSREKTMNDHGKLSKRGSLYANRLLKDYKQAKGHQARDRVASTGLANMREVLKMRQTGNQHPPKGIWRKKK